MENQLPHNSDNSLASESFRSLRKPAESFGSLPNDAEDFGNVRQSSEPFGTVRSVAERNKASHTLTVREVARLFETAGVARTERSIVNWCQPNPQGVARLDAYFDTNEHKWFITAESTERAIAEERAKAAKHAESLPNVSEKDTQFPKNLESSVQTNRHATETNPERITQLEKEVLDLKILNSGKDLIIERFSKERDGFINHLIEGSRRIGQLEAEVRQLSAPQQNPSDGNGEQ